MDAFAGYGSQPQSLNKYTYTHLDPVNNIDPSGLVSASVAEFGALQGALGSMLTTALPNIGRIVVTRMAPRLLGAFGAAAFAWAGSSLIANDEALQIAREEQEVRVLALAAVAQSRSLLFHYTDPASAVEIYGCQCIRASRYYHGHVTHGDGLPRDSGAYATPIPPWSPTMRQRDLAQFLWLRPRGRSVEAAVVIINSGDWSALTGIEWIKRAPAGYMVGIEAVVVVPNLMKP
jgi:hypothetical protein